MKTSNETPVALNPPKVALIGRVNVGKSTLFNRLSEQKIALVSPVPGTTRDRREAVVSWNRRRVILVDTGGVETPGHKKRALPVGKNDLQPLITSQTERAVEDADLILLVTSAEDGVLPQDEAWANALRGKYPVMLIVNKVDNTQRELAAGEFYRLGLGNPVSVSAISGRGSGDLLDLVVKALRKIPRRSKKNAPDAEPKNAINIAILGQPNSGKSSLLNAILGEERVVVSPIAHTTREPIDTIFQYNNHLLRLIDTAGIRRKSHVTQGVEAQGVEASLDQIERADAVVLVIDVERGPTLQDQRLARLISDRGRALVIVLNKWDLVPDKSAKTILQVERFIRSHLPGLNWAPIVFSSAKTGQRVPAILDTALAALAARDLTLEESVLGEFLKKVVQQHRPVKGSGVRHPTILSFKQVGNRPPRFEITTRGELHPSYLKFLENRLREEYGFVGTPMQMDLKAKRRKIQK